MFLFLLLLFLLGACFLVNRQLSMGEEEGREKSHVPPVGGSVVKSFYRGQNILVTGATGFVGKVLLEKILRSCHEARRVFVLIRNKKGVVAATRIKTEIIKSPIFTRLRSEIGEDEFERRTSEKLLGVAGDITEKGLGLSSDDRQMLENEVNIIHHCAASIDFRAPLNLSVDQNVTGALRMLDLAKRCKNLLVFNHVSTAYTGCHKEDGVVLEEPHSIANGDPERLYHELLKTDKNTLLEKESELIGEYPNTYTYTKNLAEHLMIKNRGNVPLCIYRPTIVGASLAEPTPGWLDVVSAASALYLAVYLGVVRSMYGKAGIADQVPVDVVVNSMLVCAMDVAGQDKYKVFHMGTSHRNPITWWEEKFIIPPYCRSHIPKKAIDVPHCEVTRSRPFYLFQYYTKFKIPAKLFWWYSSRLGTDQQKKDAARFVKTEKSIGTLFSVFGFFVDHEWTFDGTNLEELRNTLTEEDANEFNFDVGRIHWEMYLKFWLWGIGVHILKDEFDPPDNDRTAVMFMGDRRVFSDFRFAMSHSFGHHLNVKRRDTRAWVLVSRRVQQAIQDEAKEKNLSVAEVSKRAQEIVKLMAGDLRPSVLRTEAWFWRKIYRSFFNQILIDESGLQKVKDVSRKHPIVVIPTHRSYLDFLLISYLFFHYQIPLPQIAAGEDFLNLKVVNWLFRHSGAFFMRRGFGDDPLYRSIFTEYVQGVLCNGYPLEFFIEGTRSRTGMTLSPKFGVLSIILDTFFDQTFDPEITDIYVIPVSMTYEKLVDGEAHVRELLGEPKKPMSTFKLLKEIPTKLIYENYGKIAVQFAEPISLREYIEEHSEDFPPSGQNEPMADPLLPSNPSRGMKKATLARSGGGKAVKIIEPKQKRSLLGEEEGMNQYEKEGLSMGEVHPLKKAAKRNTPCWQLGYQITSNFAANMLILSTSLVSAVLLSHRSTGVSMDVLVEQYSWLKEQIKFRGGRVDEPRYGRGEKDVELPLVHRALSLLSDVVENRNQIIEVPRLTSPGSSSSPSSAPSPSPSSSTAGLVSGGNGGGVLDPNASMRLAIYRNQLIHVFVEDAIVFAAFHFLALQERQKDKRKEIVPYRELVKEVSFLRMILETEFVLIPVNLHTDGTTYETEAIRMIGHTLQQGVLFEEKICQNDSEEQYIWTTSNTKQNQAIHHFLLSTLLPFLETYWFVSLAIDVWIRKNICQKPLVVSHMQWLARRLYLDSVLSFAESSSLVSIKYALGRLIDVKALSLSRNVLERGEWGDGVGSVLGRLSLYFPSLNVELIQREIERFPLLRSRL